MSDGSSRSRSRPLPGIVRAPALGWILAGILAGLLATLLAGPAASARGAETAQVFIEFDLDAGQVRAWDSQHELAFSTAGDSVRARLGALGDALARGEDPRGERFALGQLLLAPLATLLEPAVHWQVLIPAAEEPAPGRLAPLAALLLPWEGGRLPVAARHRVSFGWPGDGPASPATAPAPAAAQRSGALLLVAPFERGVEPATDDPDTLRAALRGALDRVDLLPRNEITPRALREALRDAEAGAVWLRALPAQLGHLLPAFDALPELLIWTLPAREPGARAGLTRSTFGGNPPRTVLVQVWPGSESARARAYRQLADALARGESAAEALASFQRERAEAGAPPAQWAGFAVVGDPDLTADLDRAPWLRRLFGAP